MEHKKKKLSIDEQIEHMKNLGIKFNLVSEEQAKAYLENDTYFFKIKAYAKNYDKNKEGKYTNLDFGYLKELSLLDVWLRNLVLFLCLQLEHYLKVEINRHICQNEKEDGYNIIEEYKKSDFYKRRNASEGKAKSHYNEDIVEKYKNDYAIWNFMEIMSFGELIELYKCYFSIYEEKKEKLYDYLFCAKHLRNACAHNNCILNNVRKMTKKTNVALLSYVNANSNLSSKTINTQCKKVIVNDFVSLLYCVSKLVLPLNNRTRIKQELEKFVERTKEHITYFKSNSDILSLLVFFEGVIQIVK